VPARIKHSSTQALKHSSTQALKHSSTQALKHQALKHSSEDREEELRRRAKAKGIPFLGLRKLRSQKTTDTPQTIEPRRNLEPRVAAANKWSRIEALLRLNSFIRDYREA
jgi:hypothetical protein